MDRKALEEAFSQMGSSGNRGASDLAEKDKKVRQAVADLYMSLDSQKPELAISMLAEHVAIIVAMINEFKKK